ncbi:transcriptional regulator [Fulvitalea axinellae]|uniref:Transcriptional regulator n=1 Tax=Fulvitalea axinellae TaxID=1182444 RepID=A0AAU9CQU4_9BACT|nr:transcriptional regulator [Fulvitalea axinellae]
MELKIDHNSPVPLHAQAEALLKELIIQDEYQKEGRLLPNEVDLAKRLGISRNTLRQAINKLVFEGLLSRKKGVGTRVIKKQLSTQLENWTSFRNEMKRLGKEVVEFEILADQVKADKDVANKLRIEPGTTVTRLSKVRGTDEGPIVWFVSYFHPRVGLTGEEDFTRPLYEILEQDCSTVPSLSREELQADLADQNLAEKLKIKNGDAILTRKREVYDPGNRPIEYNICYYRGDKFVYTIDIHR